MGKFKPSRPDAAARRDLGERMAERLMDAALSGPSSVDLPDYCGECRYYQKELQGVRYGRCHRNPPEVPEPLFDEVIADVTDFGYLRPPVFPEDTGCGEGERGF